MSTCVHGDVCKTWMYRTGHKTPLVCACPNGCKFFLEEFKYTEVVEQRYSSGPYGYIKKTTTTWSEV